MLSHSLTKNHSLVEGNKQITWLASVVFYVLNGAASELSDGQDFELVWTAPVRSSIHT